MYLNYVFKIISYYLQARFLREVSEAKDSNKMDARSLAIVFTPCLFSVEEEDFHAKNAENKTKSLEAKLDVVQTLISNASRVRTFTEMVHVKTCFLFK